VLSPFGLPFVHHGLIQIGLLAVAGGLLGTWIVLRGLAFFAHAVTAASFPGLVLAGGLGFAPPLGAFAVGGVFAATVGQVSARDRRAGYDTVTALALVAALAAGAILASDVFHSSSQVDSLLFGSLLVIDTGDQVLAAVSAVAAVVATWLVGPRWLATGFDGGAARAMGVRSGWTDLLLLGLVGLAAVAALAAVGALLAGALLVIPAATTRLWTDRLRTWQIASVGLAAAEGVVGLWLSVELNAPPGATIAVLAGAVFAVAPLLRIRRRLVPAGTPAALVAIAATALLALAGCGRASDGKPTVVATTTQIADFTRAVGGDAIDVHQILNPNTDPHEYEPRPDDVQATADAKVVFANGDGLDAWMKNVADQAGDSGSVVSLSEATRTQLAGSDDEPTDPHWWHDPQNAEAAVERIRAELGQAIPAAKDGFDRRAAAYVSRIDAMDKRITKCFASVAADRRKLVTSHDAFAYLANHYGLHIVGTVVPSQSTQAQPSAGDVARLVEQVRSEHVRAVFFENSVNSKLAKAVARQTGARGDLELYGDTLGADDSPAATYISMEMANADAMMRGFTGGKRGCP
jgi:ABC-type Zn uptake system ZnuABC Zn-binding protein ZnuA/ABC-type Mn2+/Zn2+ transport system permease subunit